MLRFYFEERTMLSRLNGTRLPSAKGTSSKLAYTAHQSVQSSVHHNINRIHFSIKQNVNTKSIIFIKCNKLTHLNTPHHKSIRLFTSKLPKHPQPKSTRTFNPGLSKIWRDLGFNANPWKVALCGAFGGFCGALCGVGGGIVMIPLLRTITTMTAHQISGTRSLSSKNVFTQCDMNSTV